MPRRYNGLFCKICNRHLDVCGPLSARGKCQDCALGLAVMSIREMFDHDGYHFQRWRKSMAACVGGVLVDEPREPE